VSILYRTVPYRTVPNIPGPLPSSACAYGPSSLTATQTLLASHLGVVPEQSVSARHWRHKKRKEVGRAQGWVGCACWASAVAAVVVCAEVSPMCQVWWVQWQGWSSPLKSLPLWSSQPHRHADVACVTLGRRPGAVGIGEALKPHDHRGRGAGSGLGRLRTMGQYGRRRHARTSAPAVSGAVGPVAQLPPFPQEPAPVNVPPSPQRRRPGCCRLPHTCRRGSHHQSHTGEDQTRG
jgi:hypothetical protein